MFKKEIYLERRKTLKKILKTGVVLIPGNEPSSIETFANHYPFRQNSVFLYYTGIKIPSVTLLIDIDEDKEFIFADDFSIEDQVWTGPVVPFTDTAEKAGLNIVKGTSELKSHIDSILGKGQKIHYPPMCCAENLIKLAELMDCKASAVNGFASKELIKAILFQREFKSEEEIKEIESALDVSFEIYNMLSRNIKSGLIERELIAEMNKIIEKYGLFYSFPTILTKHGEYLHNLSCNNVLRNGDLVLVDSGVISQEGYASDITRTFPVSGKYTQKQKEIYNIVLNANLEAINITKKGILYRDVHLKASEIIASGLKELGIMKGNANDAVKLGVHALFMPHGLGHMLGMDDHDMEVFGEDNVGYDSVVKRSSQFGLSALRFARELKQGHVVTVEPGIYFIPNLIKKWKSENKFTEFLNYDKIYEYLDFGGIRLEDDILVTESNAKVLGRKIPKTIEEIENIMNN